MVVNLAVEDDHCVAIFGIDRLIATGQVNDFEPGSAERTGVRAEDPLLVRAAMDERIGRGLDALPAGRPVFGRKSNNATQLGRCLFRGVTSFRLAKMLPICPPWRSAAYRIKRCPLN